MHFTIDEGLAMLRREESRAREKRRSMGEEIIAALMAGLSKKTVEDTARAIDSGKEKVGRSLSRLDIDVRNKPWAVMTGVTAALFLTGYIIGLRRNSRRDLSRKP